ncbi:transglycosylase SLT domain-containing protein [Xanthomonas euvesicatoria pv. allii]|nr:transglycosylase SLT domain-containing protein [Xanthomonas euvesicatoria]MCP3041634.1 transglycosylase SLT domain-containing protein [Xanthomonas euvesicatoria pv. allii]
MAAGLLAAVPLFAGAQTPAQPLAFEKLAAECAPDVHPTTLKGVVSTESSWNPYAIGVVGGRLDRQPRSLAEAVATARELERQGFNFSMGLGQVNRYNLAKYGESYETVFEPCRNLKAGSAILKDCFQRAKAQMGDDQQALRAAFSCYYSGNFTRGFRPDKAGQPSYVQKVVAKATGAAQPIPVVPAVKPESYVAVRPAGRPAGPAKQAAAPSGWVIFADGAQPSGQSVAPTHAESAKEPAVQVQLVTPAATAGRAERVQTQREAQAVPVQRATANSAQQDAPFVQFVN